MANNTHRRVGTRWLVIVVGIVAYVSCLVFFLTFSNEAEPMRDGRGAELLDEMEEEIQSLRAQLTQNLEEEGELDVLSKWVDAVEERDEVIKEFHTRAIRDEENLAMLRAELGRLEQRGGGVDSHSIHVATKSTEEAVKTTKKEEVTRTQTLNVPSSHEKTCEISWDIPRTLTDYFWGESPSGSAMSTCIKHPQTLATRCYVKGLKVHPSKIDVAYGGEPLDSVMGQIEDVEYAKYGLGSFESEERDLLPKDHDPHRWFINKVLKGMVGRGDGWSGSCSSTTTLFITRYEYVNLFHTMTDWWNVYDTAPAGFWEEGGKVDVVWLDGHAEGNLDGVWGDAFGNSRHVKHLKEGECFQRAIIVPAGYSSPLWFNNRSWRAPPCHEMADAFAKHMIKSHGLEGTSRVEKRVVIIDRKPYIAHPRSKKGMPRVIENLQDLELAIQRAGGDVRVVDFARLTFAEQLREVREADLLVGIHGAGLSHVMFMSDGATLVELGTNSLGMFSGFATWKQHVKYKEVKIGGGDGNFILKGRDIDTVVGALTG